MTSSIEMQARSWLGTRYHHQGRMKRNANHAGGVDCIGLIIGVCEELSLKNKQGDLVHSFDEQDYGHQPDGIRLQQQLRKHFDVIPLGQKQAGDIALFRFDSNPQHVGFISDYRESTEGIIHCYAKVRQVVEHHLDNSWKLRLVECYRIACNG